MLMMEKATFSAGCFWAVQAAFDEIEGVKTQAGYSGGHTRDPTYKQVSTGKTGHAESVQIEYDPREVGYDALLEKFWEIHDPTTLNRQGYDIGTQYRSVIFYHSEEQKTQAEKSREKEQEKHAGKIVTEIVPYSEFYPAEEHHQKYFQKQKQRLL